MAGSFGANEYQFSGLSTLVMQEDYHVQKQETIASGTGSITRGTVLARDASTGKYTTLSVWGSVSDEVIGTGDGTEKTFTGKLAHKPVIGRKVTVTAGSVSGTDDGYGNISGTGISGTIDYGTGDISVTFSDPVGNGVNVTVDYKYGDTNDKHIPRAILVYDVNAEDQDVVAQVFMAGKYRLSDLVWPDDISDEQKSDCILSLQDKGIIVE